MRRRYDGDPYELLDFVRESNRIEGIHREPTQDELAATAVFVTGPSVTEGGLAAFVAICQPGAVPRFDAGLNVRVGNHYPPRGGPMVRTLLNSLLNSVNTEPALDAYTAHVRYELIHPFTDGNGRSGRALWLWRMGGIEKAPLGFLHHFYYQSLAASEASGSAFSVQEFDRP